MVKIEEAYATIQYRMAYLIFNIELIARISSFITVEEIKAHIMKKITVDDLKKLSKFVN